MIDVQQISKQFRIARKQTITAVQHVSLQAHNGCITGLLGSNGAGKTTTLRMVAGLFPPDAGSITVDGLDMAQPQQTRQALARMGILGDAHGLYPRLTARENIVYFGRLQGMNPDAAHARASELARLLEMTHFLERCTEGFSQGERMKTALARALVHNPVNIILDEPTNGLDVLATRSLREVLRYLCSPAGGEKCVIFSTHIMPEVQQLCNHVVIIAKGCSVAQGSVDELMAQAGKTHFEDAFVELAFGNHGHDGHNPLPSSRPLTGVSLPFHKVG